MRPATFTPAEIEAIRTDWLAHVPLRTICARHGRGHEVIRRLADEQEWPERRDREPLPPGSAATWGLIAAGSIYEGVSFARLMVA